MRGRMRAGQGRGSPALRGDGRAKGLRDLAHTSAQRRAGHPPPAWIAQRFPRDELCDGSDLGRYRISLANAAPNGMLAPWWASRCVRLLRAGAEPSASRNGQAPCEPQNPTRPEARQSEPGGGEEQFFHRPIRRWRYCANAASLVEFPPFFLPRHPRHRRAGELASALQRRPDAARRRGPLDA